MSDTTTKATRAQGSSLTPDAAARLVERVRDGDTDAFDGLVNEYKGMVFNLAYRMVNNHAEATDLTQEVFIKIYRNIASFRGGSAFSTWVYALAANTCRNRLRQLKRRTEVEGVSLDYRSEAEDREPVMQPPSTEATPDEQAQRRDVRSQVELALSGVPAEFRMVVVMKDLQGLSYEEIGAALDCPLGTVKSRLARGRRLVQDQLRGILEP